MVVSAAEHLSEAITDAKKYTEVLQSAQQRVVVAHFEASWAEECSAMNEVLQELAKEFSLAVFVRADAEGIEDITRGHEIESVPTVLILRNGKELARVEGMNAAELNTKVQQHVTEFVPPISSSAAQNPPIDSEDLNTKLKRLIDSAPCMLFMKGDPDTPKCGFSRQIIEILNQHKIQYSTFDILEDNSVRQGLKTYSNWPTFPQLYANGELVGGLDIVKELAADGELEDSLPKAEDLDTRLKKLINKASVMVFMKGNPQNPVCKFSKALMGIMNTINVSFDSFDILQDSEVREGLKKYSNWPTYPQLYVNGELVGGLDIIKELHESNELLSTLAGAI